MVLSGFIYRNMTSERKQNPAKLVFSVLFFRRIFDISGVLLVYELSLQYHVLISLSGDDSFYHNMKPSLAKEGHVHSPNSYFGQLFSCPGSSIPTLAELQKSIKNLNQILPQEKRVNCDNFST